MDCSTGLVSSILAELGTIWFWTKKWQTYTDTQVSQLYISEIIEKLDKNFEKKIKDKNFEKLDDNFDPGLIFRF